MSTAVHRQEVLAKALLTRAVTLYPNQALVKREVASLDLKPGPNEIEIYGLTPTIDEHSIKVDGVGSASVTDITIDLVSNREAFEQAYPDDTLLGFESEDDEDETDEDESSAAVKQLNDEIEDLQKSVQREQKKYDAIASRLALWKSWYDELDANKLAASQVGEHMETYQSRWNSMNDELTVTADVGLGLKANVRAKRDELEKAEREERRQKRQARLEQAKKKKEREMQRETDRKEERRIRDERIKFWPKQVYKLTVSLDMPTETPGSSRRSSLTEATLSDQYGKGQEQSESTGSTSLFISYITSEASWAPRYDIDLSTGNKSGKITYRAEFNNKTSESWEDAKIFLSTSQASFRGLGDEVPQMQPWHIALTKFATNATSLNSLQEVNAKVGQQSGQNSTVAKPDRNALFGLSQPLGGGNKRSSVAAFAAASFAAAAAPSQTQPAEYQNQHVPVASSYGDSSRLQAIASHYAPGQMPFTRGGNVVPQMENSQMQMSQNWERKRMIDNPVEGGDDGGQLRVDFEDTAVEDHGLTTTYELPGSRTLAPSSLTRRHKIATLPFSNLVLTSISVPKLRAAAFLRARFRNPSSSVSLLRGSAGIILDGTYLGSTTLPRTSPGQLITLPLGVDPTVQVSYAKPSVVRSTQGIFQKDSAHIFTRSIIVTNTKPVAAELLVLDQIPISEDEKLRVEMLEPKGINNVGDKVPIGTNAKEGKDKAMRWGKASASLEKRSQIRFDVYLEPKGACKLELEYVTKAPSGEIVTSK